jgi:hypothetical protein
VCNFRPPRVRSFQPALTVGFEDAARDWRRWSLDTSPEGIVDRTLAWVPSFRAQPLTETEASDALRAMNEGLSLFVSAWPYPREDDPDPFKDFPDEAPRSPSLATIENIPVGSPPKLLRIRFFDDSEYEIEFPPVYGKDLQTIKQNMRDLFLRLCSESPLKCRTSKPDLIGLIWEQGGLLLAPPLAVLLLGASLFWVARGFAPKPP